MRATCALLLVLLLLGGSSWAEEAQIPIDVKPMHDVEVTGAQLDWIRAWLREHLHPQDLAGIQVDVRNRAHPGAHYCAEARLAPRESDTYVVRRTIRFSHRSWPSWVVDDDEYSGDWALEDRDDVRRSFDVDGTRHVMTLSDRLAYELVLRVLRTVAAGRVEHAEGGKIELPELERIWWIDRETDGTIKVKSGHAWRGKWIGGHLEGDRFVVTARGFYIS